MSMRQATLVDTGEGRFASTVTTDHTATRRTNTDMRSIAAYYVILANDLAREPRRDYQVVPVRPSLSARIAAVLAKRAKPTRRAASQPA
jgi:hypothetical protein